MEAATSADVEGPLLEDMVLKEMALRSQGTIGCTLCPSTKYLST